jgi:hypothetical protein
MAQATPNVPEPFRKISVAAVNVLARLAAQRQVKAALAGEGVRVTMVPYREIMERANALLDANPRLYIDSALHRGERDRAEAGDVSAPKSA